MVIEDNMKEFLNSFCLINNIFYRYDDSSFKFEYAAIDVKPRFHISGMVQDITTHFRAVIRTSVVLKINENNELIYEYQILYRDENNEFKTECAKFSLYDYTITIKYTGDAQIQI